jgi:two-component system, OmpR family, phosphate regulon sensor histidine kinase PhoR
MTEKDQPGEGEMRREHQISDTQYRHQPFDPRTGVPVRTEASLKASGGSARAKSFQAILLGMAGHDLRQPLQIIQSTYDWLENRVGEMEKVRLRRGQRAIARLVEHLDGLVGCLLEHDLSVKPVALIGLLQRVAGGAEGSARAKGIQIRVRPTSAEVMSHPLLLEGIVRNLVENAIKYTEPGGRILIGCRRAGRKVRIDVFDTGVGLAPTDTSRIFDAFQRLHSTRSDGLGIGLFVVRRAAELLGHEIDLSSTPLRGSRFSVLASAALPVGLT